MVLMNNLNVIGKMKEEVLKTILSDQEIMSIILDKKIEKLPAMEARYTQVTPWRKVPDTQTEARSYVGFDCIVNGSINCAAKDFVLYVWVSVHDSLLPFDAAVAKRLGVADRGVRHDILADKIDYLLNGSTEMGFGKLELISSPIYEPTDGYTGRALHYRVAGWNRYGDRL